MINKYNKFIFSRKRTTETDKYSNYIEKHPTIIKYKEKLDNYTKSYELVKIILSTNGISREKIDEEITRCIDKLLPYFTIRMALPEDFSIIIDNTKEIIENIIRKLEYTKKEDLVTRQLNKEKLEKIFNKNLKKQYTDCSDILDSFVNFKC